MQYYDKKKRVFFIEKAIKNIKQALYLCRTNIVRNILEDHCIVNWKKSPCFFSLAVAAALTLTGGCLNYPKPPLAVEQSSYTNLQENEKQLLPPELDILTLRQAQELALTNNPDFQSIKFSIDSARARYYQQFSNYAPTLNANMSIAQSFGKIHAADNHIYTRSQRDNISPSLSGQWLIFDSLNREMNLLNARHTLRQTQADVDDARRLLMRAVAYAYNDVLLTHAQREIIKAQIEYSQEMLEDAERKYAAGTVLQSDVLNFRVTLRNGQLELVKINYAIKANLYILAGYLGLTDGTIPEHVKFPAITMPPKQYNASLGVYLDQALANRPDLKAARERLQALRYSFYSSLSKFGPVATANYQWDYGYNRSIAHDSNGTRHDWSSNGNFGYSFNISWNLFNGFADYFSVRAARAEVSASDYMLYQIYLSVITDVRSAYENHLSSIEQAELASEICELTRQTRDLVENEYNAGTALVTRLNEAERDLVQAQNNLATAIVNIANSQAQLEAAVYSFTPAAQPDNQ